MKLKTIWRMIFFKTLRCTKMGRKELYQIIVFTRWYYPCPTIYGGRNHFTQNFFVKTIPENRLFFTRDVPTIKNFFFDQIALCWNKNQFAHEKIQFWNRFWNETSAEKCLKTSKHGEQLICKIWQTFVGFQLDKLLNKLLKWDNCPWYISLDINYYRAVWKLVADYNHVKLLYHDEISHLIVLGIFQWFIKILDLFSFHYKYLMAMFNLWIFDIF